MTREMFNDLCVFAGLVDPGWVEFYDFVHYHRTFGEWVVRFRHILLERANLCVTH